VGHDGHMSDDSGQWWYCLKHNAVESGAGCGNTDRMGPYGSAEDASHALERAAQRTAEWEHDPNWNDED
jgi:hypothetical protein